MTEFDRPPRPNDREHVGPDEHKREHFDEGKLIEQTRDGVQVLPGKNTIEQAHEAFLTYTPDELRTMELWRPEESVEVLKRMAENHSVLIEGRAGTGKGAVLTGVRHILRLHSIGHTFLDGHHPDTPVETVLAAIEAQIENEKGGIVLVDSMDYFYGGKRSIRKTSETKYHARMKPIFEALEKVPIVVGTVHEESWTKYLGDPELVKQFQALSQRYDRYQLPEAFGSKKSEDGFLASKGFSEEERRLILNIKENRRAMEVYLERFASKMNPESAYSWDQFCEILTYYATVKLITRDVFNEHQDLLQKMRTGLESGNLDEFYTELIDYVYRKDLRLTLHPLVRT